MQVEAERRAAEQRVQEMQQRLFATTLDTSVERATLAAQVEKARLMQHEANVSPAAPAATTAPVNRRCRAPGCTSCKPDQPHYCATCRQLDVDHRSWNCPHARTNASTTSSASTAPARACRVPGCKDCRPGQVHYCKKCKKHNVDHFSRFCPDA